MNEKANADIQSASISDRGLSEKRPLNEDSFLADSERRIFAVADGVGGAQAGEVASQTAMEVLDEAFRHHTDGADIEDLMELAIQRANASIHRMSKEHPKLAMMATTIVALHLDGRTATIGHVGDSRLYRVSPDGELHRETSDHSVVEEEVRAGRMTPDQAATHPSRNVISRALGAEDTVEVDLKTIDVDDDTSFLLCSDGITRHIRDNEIREVLTSELSLEDVCAELKRRCFERGAEDNLTAVVVHIGAAKAGLSILQDSDDERTISAIRPITPTMASAAVAGSGPATAPLGETTRIAAPSPEPLQAGPGEPAHSEITHSLQMAPSASKGGSGIGKLLGAVLVLLLMGGIGVLGYLLGMARGRDQAMQAIPLNQPTPSPTLPPPTAEQLFDKRRREVDTAPHAAIAKIEQEAGVNAQNTTDPETLYLFGRGLLLTGKPVEANDAFKRAVVLLKDRPSRDPMKVDTMLGAAVAALRTGNWQAAQTASRQIEEVIETQDQSKDALPETGATPQ